MSPEESSAMSDSVDPEESPIAESSMADPVTAPVDDRCKHCGKTLGMTGARVCAQCRLAQKNKHFWLDHRLSSIPIAVVVVGVVISLYQLRINVSQLELAQMRVAEATQAARDAKAAAKDAKAASEKAEATMRLYLEMQSERQTERTNRDTINSLFDRAMNHDDRPSYDQLLALSKKPTKGPESQAQAMSFVKAIQDKFSDARPRQRQPGDPQINSECEGIQMLKSGDKNVRAAGATLAGRGGNGVASKEGFDAVARIIREDPSLEVVDAAVRSIRTFHIDVDFYSRSNLNLDTVKKALAYWEKRQFRQIACQ